MNENASLFRSLTLTIRAVETVARLADQKDHLLGTWIRRSILHLASECMQNPDTTPQISRCRDDLEICARNIGSGVEIRQALNCLIRLNQCFQKKHVGAWIIHRDPQPTVSVC